MSAVQTFVFIFLILLLLPSDLDAQSQNFKGDAGVYYLATADIPLQESVLESDFFNGLVIRTKWSKLEPSPGVFDFSFIKGEIEKATRHNKKSSIVVLSYPDWLLDMDVKTYSYIDGNTYHSTYEDTLRGVISWDRIYVSRIKNLIIVLADTFATDSRISYWNLIAGQMSRNLPSEVLGENGMVSFPVAFDYKPDTLVERMKSVLDLYMDRFPETPLWASMDYQRFEPMFSGSPKNYVARKFSDYGIETYPDRFGLWREDLSGCHPNLDVLQSSSQWHLLKENPCRTGAQMVWNVQDGPGRMNQCGMVPNTEEFVLDSALQHGISLGMRYVEVYGIDIKDEGLTEVISKANTMLIEKANECVNFTSIKSDKLQSDFKIFPNPARCILQVKYAGIQDKAQLGIYTISGQLKATYLINPGVNSISIKKLVQGVYYLQLQAKSELFSKTLIISN